MKNKNHRRDYEEALLKVAAYKFVELAGKIYKMENDLEADNFLPDQKQLDVIRSRYNLYCKKRKVRRVVVLAAIITALISITFSVFAFRSLVFHPHSSYVSVHQESEAKDQDYVKWDDLCYPTYIPDGYIAVKASQFDQMVCAEFSNGEELITLNILPIESVGNIDKIESESPGVDLISINGSAALICEKDKRVIITWDYKNWTLLLSGPDSIELIKMAESIE